MNIISSVLQQEVQELNKTATIYGINGPVIYLKGDTGFMMSEMVYVGKEKLVGEVISLDKDITTVQVYEETSGLKPGEIVTHRQNTAFACVPLCGSCGHFQRAAFEA